MKLNKDCVRALLLSLEEMLQFGENLKYSYVTLDKLCENEKLKEFSKEDIAYTTIILEEARYINAKISNADGGIYLITYSRITYAGHEFLEGIRTPENWKKVKSITGGIGNASLSIISAISEGVANAAINRYFESPN